MPLVKHINFIVVTVKGSHLLIPLFIMATSPGPTNTELYNVQATKKLPVYKQWSHGDHYRQMSL